MSDKRCTTTTTTTTTSSSSSSSSSTSNGRDSQGLSSDGGSSTGKEGGQGPAILNSWSQTYAFAAAVLSFAKAAQQATSGWWPHDGGDDRTERYSIFSTLAKWVVMWLCAEGVFSKTPEEWAAELRDGNGRGLDDLARSDGSSSSGSGSNRGSRATTTTTSSSSSSKSTQKLAGAAQEAAAAHMLALALLARLQQMLCAANRARAAPLAERLLANRGRTLRIAAGPGGPRFIGIGGGLGSSGDEDVRGERWMGQGSGVGCCLGLGCYQLMQRVLMLGGGGGYLSGQAGSSSSIITFHDMP
jgi:hypothetical protein